MDDQPTPVDFAELISLKEARALLPGRPDVSTLYRWSLSGCRGIKLEYRRIGRRIFTTKSWLDRFMREMTARDVANLSTPYVASPRTRHSQLRARQIAAAQARLAASGFGINRRDRN